jgi:hypothetical protein
MSAAFWVRPRDRHVGQRQGKVHPSEIVTLALLLARKGVGPCAFARWLCHNYATWFPGLPTAPACFGCTQGYPRAP